MAQRNLFNPFIANLFKDLQEQDWKEVVPAQGEQVRPMTDIELQLMHEADLTEKEQEELEKKMKNVSLARELRKLTSNGKKAYVNHDELKQSLGMTDFQFDKFIGKVKQNNYRHRNYSFEDGKVGFSKHKRDKMLMKAKQANVNEDEVTIVEATRLTPSQVKQDKRTIGDLLGEWGEVSDTIERRVVSALDEQREQYKTINDAAKYIPGLAKGNTEIWYYKTEAGRDLGMGSEWCIERDLLPDPKNLKKTHVYIGSIKETIPEKIFLNLQGDNWSPKGEAYNMIAKTKTHTSMSMGDIVVVKGQAFMVDRFGFYNLTTGKKA